MSQLIQHAGVHVRPIWPHDGPSLRIHPHSLSGCLGGLANAVLSGELQLPKRDAAAGVYRPGWIGTVIVGGLAALVFCGLYGPMASAVLIGPAGTASAIATLRVSELFGALLSGVAGGRLLTTEVEKKLLTRTTEQLDTAKSELAFTAQDLTKD